MAGGIRSVADAEDVLNKGADKISINSPALENPALLTDLARRSDWSFVVSRTDRPAAEALLSLYSALAPQTRY